MHNWQQKREYISRLMVQLDFPEDARNTFLEVLSCIAGDTMASRRFAHILEQYEQNIQCPYPQMLEEVKEIGATLHKHEYTLTMVLLLCMAQTLRDRYLERGMGEECFYATMMDLRYKLEECRLVHGIWGSFVGGWFGGFFAMTRFALGRLQFEMVALKEAYTVDGVTLPAGSKAINVHIPRTGTRLEREAVWKSYRMAAELFAEEFADGPVVFTCYSWLLDPWNRTVLPCESNLAVFCADYHIVASGSYDDYTEMWRLFDAPCDDLSKLPGDTSLRRAYLQRMQRGEPVGWGRGIFLYRGEA